MLKKAGSRGGTSRFFSGIVLGRRPMASHAKSSMVPLRQVVFPAPPLSAATSSPHLRCLCGSAAFLSPLCGRWWFCWSSCWQFRRRPRTHSCPCRASSRPGRSSAAQRAHNHCRMPHRSSLLPPSPLTVCDVTLLQRSGLRLQWRAGSCRSYPGRADREGHASRAHQVYERLAFMCVGHHAYGKPCFSHCSLMP